MLLYNLVNISRQRTGIKHTAQPTLVVLTNCGGSSVKRALPQPSGLYWGDNWEVFSDALHLSSKNV